ncbi:MAG: alpha/beta hydrolase [Pseudomonadota bacterium]
MAFRAFGADLRSAKRVVLALHGTPGSALKYLPASEAADERGLALIAIDRWGYAGTAAPAPQDQSLAQFGHDIAAVVDRLGVGRVDVVGISGGGPFALATAATLGERVRRVALVAPVGLLADERGKPIQGLSRFHHFCFFQFARKPRLVRAVFRAFDRILKRNERVGISLGMVRSGAADKVLLDRPDVVGHLARMMREGLSRNAEGPEIDLRLFPGVAQLSLGAMTHETRIWFGDQDGSVPEAAIVKLSETLRNATLERVTAQGHFWIATGFPTVLDWLARDEEGNRSRSGET